LFEEARVPDNYVSIRVGNEVYVHLKQDKTDECTVCCAGMIIARKKARFVPRSELRALSQNVGPANSGYRPSAQDAKAPIGDHRYAAMASIMVGALGTRGSGTFASQNLPAMLGNYGLTTDSGDGNASTVAAKLRDAVARGRIASASVGWQGGGGHSIVIAGKTKINGAEHYIILDPGHDPELVTTTPVGATRYKAPYGGVGEFFSWIVVTN
jgi:hypothetical protein